MLIKTLLPPGGPLLLSLSGILLLAHYRRVGLALLVLGIVLSYLLSIPLTANLLSRSLQAYPPLPAQVSGAEAAGAIVVLGGGLQKNAPEYGAGPTLHARTLGRVRYAARLARQTGLPVLASGGRSNADASSSTSEAEIMRDVLQDEFGVGSVFIETASRDTWENAVNSAVLLRERHIDAILLVTNAVHLPRAVAAFQGQGLKVIPAPTLFFDAQPDPTELQSWLPSASALQEIRYTCYEGLGRFWYAWRR